MFLPNYFALGNTFQLDRGFLTLLVKEIAILMLVAILIPYYYCSLLFPCEPKGICTLVPDCSNLSGWAYVWAGHGSKSNIDRAST